MNLWLVVLIKNGSKANHFMAFSQRSPNRGGWKHVFFRPHDNLALPHTANQVKHGGGNPLFFYNGVEIAEDVLLVFKLCHNNPSNLAYLILHKYRPYFILKSTFKL